MVKYLTKQGEVHEGEIITCPKHPIHHRTKPQDYITENPKLKYRKATCYRCSGEGYLNNKAWFDNWGTEIDGKEVGICFACDGNKWIPERIYTEKQFASFDKARKKREEKAEAKREVYILEKKIKETKQRLKRERNFRKAKSQRERNTERFNKWFNLKTFQDSNKESVKDISGRVVNKKHIHGMGYSFDVYLFLGDDGFMYSFSSASEKVEGSWDYSNKIYYPYLSDYGKENKDKCKKITISGKIEDKGKWNVAMIDKQKAKSSGGWGKKWNCDVPVVNLKKLRVKYYKGETYDYKKHD
jgi:hypothetical protein